MVRWWPARTAGARHPLVNSVDSLLAALDAAPTVLLVTDEAGEIVYRNQAANEMARRTMATQGEKALVVLRDTLRRDVREARAFPYTKTNELAVGGALMYGSTPVALEIIAATEPAAGSAPSADGPVGSGLVQMNRAPLSINRTAVVIASKLYVRVSPRTT